MSVKAIEMVRKIRDKQYKETKDLSLEIQIQYIKRKSDELLRDFKSHRHSTADNTGVTAKI
ncbi:MAG: hypothetical protein ABH873_08570 [Candidatus Firestonebacteria bacterium]